MAEFSWKGPGKMEEKTLDRARAPELSAPSSPSVVDPNKTKLYACGVPGCVAKFKKPMILARHFNTNHEDLKTDKDSWREFLQEVWV